MTVVENEKAITSWSGFIYQGMIAVLTSLHKLSQNYELYRPCVLKIEKLDDFSIHNQADVCLSLHQVKCKKSKYATAYTDAVSSLTQKKSELLNVTACLHTSVQVNGYTNTEVDLYNYSGQLHMPILQVEEYQKRYLDKVLTDQFAHLDISNEGVFVLLQKMNFLVINKVLEAHAANMENDTPLGIVDRSIRMSDFIDLIESYGEIQDPFDYIQTYKQHFSLLSKEFIIEQELSTDSIKHLENIFEKINSLADEKFEQFLQILVPDSDLEKVSKNNILKANPSGFNVPFLLFIAKTFQDGIFCDSKCRYEVMHENILYTPFAVSDSSDLSKISFANKLFYTMMENKKSAAFYYTGDVIVSRETDIENLFDFISKNSEMNPYPSNGTDFDDPKRINVINYREALRLLGY